MKITEIEIDDSQTGYCWIQIYAKNRKQAISLKHQILNDQLIRERLETEIIQSQNIASCLFLKNILRKCGRHMKERMLQPEI